MKLLKRIKNLLEWSKVDPKEYNSPAAQVAVYDQPLEAKIIDATDHVAELAETLRKENTHQA